MIYERERIRGFEFPGLELARALRPFHSGATGKINTATERGTAASSLESLRSSFALVGMAVPLYYFTYRGQNGTLFRNHVFLQLRDCWSIDDPFSLLELWGYKQIYTYLYWQFHLLLSYSTCAKQHPWIKSQFLAISKARLFINL